MSDVVTAVYDITLPYNQQELGHRKEAARTTTNSDHVNSGSNMADSSLGRLCLHLVVAAVFFSL